MANTSTSYNSPILEAALANVTTKFRVKIISTYLVIKNRYSHATFDNSFDSSGLSVGKFCETVLRFLQEELTGSYTPFTKQIQNFAEESRKLIVLPTTSGQESLRIIIPRALVFLYTVRGKRGIGHIGGDVDANGIDAATIVRLADWIVCELIRIYHELPIEEAQDIVDSLSSRNVPDIWEIDGKKRILRNDLDYKQKVLLLSYSEIQNGVMVEDLYNWTEYSSLSMFRKSVLFPLHQSRLIEYNQETDTITLSPLGIQKVEEEILQKS
jgi:hypothetical protein